MIHGPSGPPAARLISVSALPGFAALTVTAVPALASLLAIS